MASDPAVIDALNVLKGLNTKNDAFSVFGSFDANAGAQAGKASTGTENQGTGASLKIGRVFSTGVAAQNLTEGFRSVYAQSRLDAVTSCLNGVSAVVKDIADAAEKAKQAAALSAFCKPEQSRQSVGAP
ncbi:MAG: hypothetical protein LH481_03595 [Burkholderiales bacterium]|nr:hypothetical protein [Burkholderiales bacterium]